MSSSKTKKPLSLLGKINLCLPRFILLPFAASTLALALWAVWILPSKTPRVNALGPIGITVSDLRTALPFYRDVLHFKKVWESDVDSDSWEKLQGISGLRMRTIRLSLGQEYIHLNQYLSPRGRAIPMDSRSNDLWFQHLAIVVSDMERAYAYLRRHHVRHVSISPQRIPDWNKNAAGIKAFYFQDPDGHVLEIIYFPPGKGDPRWQVIKQKAPQKLFLGIDHTALGISNTQKSLDFYRDLFALEVIASGINHGIEQSRLNNIKNARVKITTLKAPQGPGIEFLHYLSPGPGRPYPSDTQANDLWHWQTTLYVNRIDSFWQHLQSQRHFVTKIISKSVVSLGKSKHNYGKGFLTRDPDGHGILIIEK